MPYKKIDISRMQIENSLSKREIFKLSKDKSIKVLQFSTPIKNSTLSLLNEYFFSHRNDVLLRVYGFYGLECDLQFISEMTNVCHFSADCLMGAKSVEYIPKMTKLKSLGVGIYNLTNFNFIDDVSDVIEDLSLLGTMSKKPDLAVIAKLKKLKRLYLEGQQKNIEVISKLSNLENLTLRSITTLTLNYIQPLKKLWLLNIKLGGIKDFTALENKNSIKYLELWQIRGLKDLPFVSKMHGLQFLYLQSLKNVKSLPDFTGLKKLKRIYLENLKGLMDLYGLRKAPALEEMIYINASQLQPKDLMPALENPSLKSVSVGFGSEKKNNSFKILRKEHGKDEFKWTKFSYL